MTPGNLSDLQPLAGVKIVSLAANIPGPVAAARLRDLGASVNKFEPPDGDALARACPAWYESLHNGVTVITADLKTSDEQQRLFSLLAESDLLLTSSRPASLERLGLAWNKLQSRFPELSQVAIVGHRPPDENKPGHDLTYQAALGLVDPPRLPRALLADLGGAADAVIAALGLLMIQKRERQGRFVHVSLAEAAERFALPELHGLTAPGGVLGGGWPAYNLYQAAEGWIAVAALETQFSDRLQRELKLPSLSHSLLSNAFSKKTDEEWERWGATHDLPVAAVRRP